MSQADLQAIHSMFTSTQAKTPDAKVIREQWLAWYPTLSWFDKMKSDIALSARARRDAFFRANAVTAKEKEQVAQVQATSMKLEDIPNPVAVIARRIGLITSPSVREPSAPAVKMPTIRLGSSGPAVSEWQKRIGTSVDGKFGKGTEGATMKWQGERGMKVDGIVGPATWMASYVTDKSPAPIPVAVHDSKGVFPSAKAAPIKRTMTKHVVEVAKKAVQTGKNVATADLSTIKSEASMLPTAVKVGGAAAVAGGLFLAVKKFWK